MQVLEVEDVLQDEGSRRRMRVLTHLPLTATFKLCEVDLAGGALACACWMVMLVARSTCQVGPMLPAAVGHLVMPASDWDCK